MDDFDDFNEYLDFQDFQDFIQDVDDDGLLLGGPPVRESRLLWDRSNPLINISDTEFR
jgi:hypothetical protein